MSEADIHFEFYRHLMNAIEDEPCRNGVEFGDVRPEYGDGIDGFADIVLFNESGDPVVVIEAKAPSESSQSRREVDPYSPDVIRQGFRYAGNLGVPYFCTFNGERLVVFDSYEEGIPLLERSTKSYEISSLDAFAGTFLDEIARIRAGDARWDASDDAFIERIQSLHEKTTPELQDSLADHLEEDEAFRTDFMSGRHRRASSTRMRASLSGRPSERNSPSRRATSSSTRSSSTSCWRTLRRIETR